MTIQKSRVVYGTMTVAAVTVWQDSNGIIWLRQNGRDITYEAFECGSEDFYVTSQMAQEIGKIADAMID